MSGDWSVQRLGGVAICTLAKSFAISTTEQSGFGQTLRYGAASLRVASPVTFSGQPAAVANVGNRSGFVDSCNYDTVTQDLVVSMALMNFSAPDVFLRAVMIGEVA